MSESAYKPTEAYEDELDQLAHSIRSELRSAGFRPAFDAEPEETAASRRIEDARRRRHKAARWILLSYVVPALMIVAICVAVRLAVSGF